MDYSRHVRYADDEVLLVGHCPDGGHALLQDSLRLRDDEQLVVKLSYRFEL